ncbi:TIGR01212 family radical SAM protein, partial [Cetobacterium sp.]
VLGLAIGTRPDCIEDDTLELLKEINEKHFFWIELGLQTIDDKVAKIINRGYPLSTYIETSKKLKDSGIKFVTHMIVGLPTEEREDILNTAKCIVQSGAWGIKIHSLHIIKGTPLERLYNDKKFKVFTLDEYVDIVVTILKLLPDKMVVHRVTGDGKKDEVVEPKWSLNKRKVLNEIEKELKKRENI